MGESYTIYDHEELYNTNILPLILKIKEICRLNKIPFYCSCAVKNKDDVTEYKHDGVMTGSAEVNLFDDRFENILMVLNGAKIQTVATINCDDDFIGQYTHIDDDIVSDDVIGSYDNITVIEEPDMPYVSPEEFDDSIEPIIQEEAAPEPKRKRGRPRKNPSNVVMTGKI